MQEKFQQLMLEEHLTAGKLAEMLEVQPAVISHMLSGRNKPSFPLIQKILRRFPQLNPYWLLLDDPQMYRDGYIPEDNEHKTTMLATDNLFAEAAEAAKYTEINTESLTSRESNISEILPIGTEISNSRNISSSSQQAANRPSLLASDGSPKIERIIAIYSDGTFRDFTKR